MDKIWLKSYPAGVPAEIDINEFRSLVDLFEQGVRRFASCTAYICMGKGITYAELDRLSAQFAGYLQGELKLPAGARVALMMPNLLQYPVALFGTLRAGYTVVNVNPLYTPRGNSNTSCRMRAQTPSSSSRISPIRSSRCARR